VSESRRGHRNKTRPFRCLEHGRDSKIQSLFNPEFRPYVERFLKAFSDRYRETGMIQCVLLGVSGMYGGVASLNAAWNTRYASFDAIEPFLPDRAVCDQARADFVEWYQQAMTDWAVFWARTARKAFPGMPVYVSTGGNGDPMFSADFTAQAAALASVGVGLRITNETSDYRLIVLACSPVLDPRAAEALRQRRIWLDTKH
jgi:hypothetical protein